MDNPYLQALKTAQAQSVITSTTTLTAPDILAEYDLGGVNCKLCDNTGRIIQRGPGLLELHVYECGCMKRRRSLRSLRKAGMEDMARRYTLKNYVADNKHRAAVKDAAMRYINSTDGWFFIAGQSGSGKTHICTAICTAIMRKQDSEVYFMPWRDDSVELKQRMKQEDWYQARIKKLKRVPVLYIDDFFKGGASDADIKLAFEILNARYNDTTLRTVISSEIDLDGLMRIDEAIGGRIYERSRGFAVMAPSENVRLS